MRRLARRDALLGQADAAELQGRSGENPRHAAHGDERAERPARGRNGRRDQPPLRAHGAGVHAAPVRAARRQAGREPRPAARGVARAGSRLCVTRRTWLFVPGADQAAHRAAARSGADVIVLELEDFTPPELRPKARSLSPRTLELWRKAGANRLGYRMKSLVQPSHARAINRVFTPGRTELLRARRVVAAFEKARKAGKDRATVGGALIEMPIYTAAKRLLESAARSSPPRRKKSR